MKTWILGTILIAVFSSNVCAEEFLGAPLPPGGSVVSRRDDRLDKRYEVSPQAILDFYKEVFRNEENIKFRVHENFTIIEDHGNRPWRSITIYQGDRQEVKVLVAKDSWSWLLGTLTLRFLGVYAVMALLLLVMSFSNIIVRYVSTKYAESG